MRQSYNGLGGDCIEWWRYTVTGIDYIICLCHINHHTLPNRAYFWHNSFLPVISLLAEIRSALTCCIPGISYFSKSLLISLVVKGVVFTMSVWSRTSWSVLVYLEQMFPFLHKHMYKKNIYFISSAQTRFPLPTFVIQYMSPSCKHSILTDKVWV